MGQVLENFLETRFLSQRLLGAKSFSLQVDNVIDGDGHSYGSYSWSRNNASTQYLNKSAEGKTFAGKLLNNTSEFELNFFQGGINICHPAYGKIVASASAVKATG